MQQNSLRMLAGDHVVVDDKDTQMADRLAVDYRRLNSLARFQRQLHNKPRTLSGFTFQRDAAVHQRHEVLGDRHPKPRPLKDASAAGGLLLKRIEDALLEFRADADAGISDLETHKSDVFLGLFAFNAQGYAPALRCEFDCVAEQIHQDLVDAQFVARTGQRKVFFKIDVERKMLLCGLLSEYG